MQPAKCPLVEQTRPVGPGHRATVTAFLAVCTTCTTCSVLYCTVLYCTVLNHAREIVVCAARAEILVSSAIRISKQLRQGVRTHDRFHLLALIFLLMSHVNIERDETDYDATVK
jgi:hypothetical protein